MAAGPAFTNPTQVWPFGFITVVSGSPIAVTANIGSQRQSIGAPGTYGTSKFAQKVTSITFYSLTTNAGAIYVLKPGYTRAQTNGVIMILGPGDREQIQGSYATGGLMPDDFWIDGTVSGDQVHVLGVRGSA